MYTNIKCGTCDKKIISAGIVYKDKYFCCVECYRKYRNNEEKSK